MYRTFPWHRSLDGYLWETPGSSGSSGSSTGDSGGGGGAPSLPSSSGGSPPPSSSSTQPSGTPPASMGDGQSGATPPSSQPGPVEYSRFKEVNDQLASLRWATEHDPKEVSEATRLYRWFDTDPEGAYQYLTGVLTRQGVLKTPQSQSSARPDPLADPSTGRPLPDIVIQETGQRLYSAEQAQKLGDWIEARFDQRIKPLEERTLAGQAQDQARVDARNQIAEAERTWPHFNDHAEAIFAELQKDRRLSLEGAYRRVVVPKIRALERDLVIQEMRGKANAGTTNPTSTSPSASVEPSKLSLKELFRREMQKRGMGA